MGDNTKRAATYTDAADYKSKCCKAVVAATNKKCSDMVAPCSGIYEVDAAAANSTCSPGRDFAGACESPDKSSGESGVCCKKKTGICHALTATGCADGTFADKKKETTAATTANYKDNCCTKSVTCKDFQAAAVAGSTSSAMAQHSPAMLVLLVLGGAVTVAFGK